MTWLNIAGWKIAPHVSQLRRYDPTASFRLQEEGCTPTSGANGMNTVTGKRLRGDDVMARIPRYQETDPNTPGWSLKDLDRAMAELGVGFEVRSGRGRTGVRAAWVAGLAVVIQGDSEEFSNQTCSGAFNGDHCICVYPARKLIYGVWHRWTADPICGVGRWERESEIWAYAENLNSGIRYGVFTKPVTKTITPPDTSVATHRAYFARNAQVKRFSVDARGLIRGPWANGHYYAIEVWDNPASSAPCTAPIHRKTADGKSGALTVTVTKGHFVGNIIAVSSTGLDIKEV